MRRRSAASNKADIPWKLFNVRKETDPKRLQAIGALMLEWNYIEGAINMLVGLSLRQPFPMWVPISSRINGIDGKLAIIKQTFDLPTRIPDEHQLPIRKALNAIEYYKKYRDGVAHAVLFHPDQIIADTAQRKGLTDEVLLSQEALDCLNDHLDWLMREMDEVATIIHYRVAGALHSGGSDPKELVEAIQASLARLLTFQNQRENLKPLPEFPDQPPTEQASAAAQGPAD